MEEWYVLQPVDVVVDSRREAGEGLYGEVDENDTSCHVRYCTNDGHDGCNHKTQSRPKIMHCFPPQPPALSRDENDHRHKDTQAAASPKCLAVVVRELNIPAYQVPCG